MVTLGPADEFYIVIWDLFHRFDVVPGQSVRPKHCRSRFETDESGLTLV